jgi:NDP-sugar pyrophosphorylase family protein
MFEVFSKVELTEIKKRVIITTSGTGERLKYFTKFTNKSLIKVGDKYAICYIIESYSYDTEFIITLGYYGTYVKQFLQIAYPNHTFFFVEIDKFQGEGSSLAYSLLCAKEYLQQPFTFHCCDTIIIDQKQLNFKDNVVYVYKTNDTSINQSYTGIKINDNCDLINFTNKGDNHDFLYIGIAFIKNYAEFWDILHNIYISSPNNPQLNDVSAYNILINMSIQFKYHTVEKWYDTGNLNSYSHILQQFPKQYTILEKNNESICFFPDKVIKFINDTNINQKRAKRGHDLFPLTPKILSQSDNFIVMEKIDGILLSEHTETNIISDLLLWALENLWKNPLISITNKRYCREFYILKTKKRISELKCGFPNENHVINGLFCKPIDELIEQLDTDWILNDTLCNFHGDFIFENIIQTPDKSYKLLDWRHEFSSDIFNGDIYYDFAKLQHNLIINHKNIIQKLFQITINKNYITVDLKCNFILIQQIEQLKSFVIQHGFDYQKVNVIMSLIWINMASLYENELQEFLFYFGKYNLQKYVNVML